MKMRIKLIPTALIVIIPLVIASCKKSEEKKTESENKTVTKTETRVEEKTETKEPEKEENYCYYKIRLEGNMLSLYEKTASVERCVVSNEITPENYPKEDILKLRDGIDIFCLEDGYEMLENFAN